MVQTTTIINLDSIISELRSEIRNLKRKIFILESNTSFTEYADQNEADNADIPNNTLYFVADGNLLQYKSSQGVVFTETMTPL